VGVESAPLAEDPAQLDLIFRVRDGRPYRVAEVRFAGQRFTHPRWAARAAALAAGAPLTLEALDEARRRLFGHGLYRAVVPAVDYLDDGGAVVTFDLEERPRLRVAYGFRWATGEGLAAVVDAVDRNAFGRGVKLGVRARWAQDDKSGRFFSSVPNVFGTKAALELFVEERELIEEVTTTTSLDGTLQLRLPRGERGSLRFYAQYRDSLVEGEIEIPPFGTFPIEERLRRPILGVQWLHDARDDKLAATRGWFASADLSGAGPVIGSDFAYLRLLAQGSRFRRVGRVGDRPVVWAQSLSVGLARTFDDQPLIRQERFFAGGEYSVRGYEEDGLGPLEDLGGVIRPAGGEALLVINQELRFPLRGRFGGVVFFDAGNVWARRRDFLDDLFTAAGFGLRILTPVGVVRGDLAFPLDRRPADDRLQLYVGFGNTF